MKRIYSLKGKKLFNEVYRKGNRFSERGITVIIIEENLSSDALTSYHSAGNDVKIGIVVPKKIGRAHERNREKRKIRAICRELLPVIKNGTRIIIRLKKHYQALPFTEGRGVLTSLFTRAGIIQ